MTNYGPGYRYQLFWSPDSKKLAFIDQAMQIKIFDITTGASINVDNLNIVEHRVEPGGVATGERPLVAQAHIAGRRRWLRAAGERCTVAKALVIVWRHRAVLGKSSCTH